MQSIRRITPCLWFDNQAEEAAEFYGGTFKNSRIGKMSRYGEAGHEVHGQAAGTVMTVAFGLDWQGFVALNGAPTFKFNEASSFQVNCETQEEMDYYWEKLSEAEASANSSVPSRGDPFELHVAREGTDIYGVSPALTD